MTLGFISMSKKPLVSWNVPLVPGLQFFYQDNDFHKLAHTIDNGCFPCKSDFCGMESYYNAIFSQAVVPLYIIINRLCLFKYSMYFKF